MNVAVILAGGSGNRFGESIPKQFYKIKGKTILEYSVDAFEKNPGIDEIAIVSKPDYLQEIERIISRNGYTKVNHILPGGNERFQSSLSAINYFTDDRINLFIHDAVRPMISQRIINDCIEAMKYFRVVNVAIPATDTIIESDPSHEFMIAAPDRNLLMFGQSPQCFKRGVIKKAYDIALQDPGFRATDDCGIICKYLPEERIGIIKGDPINLKITYSVDIYTLEAFQRKRKNQQ